MARTSFTVTELNAHIKQLLDADALLGNVCVTGELSNYKVYPSGHHYFTLKDAESSLRCVMFRSSAQSLRFRPASGMSVAAIGRIAVYPRDGAYQLYCTRLIPGGVGDLYAAYEQLKEQLQKEGLFDRAHKKPLPLFPQRIAVITSAAGAAVRDIIRVLGKRWPASEVVLLPVRVQGDGGTGGDRRSDPVCQPLSGRRPHHHRPRRRFDRGLWASMTSVSRGRSTIRISRSFPPSGTSRM